jgi:hypothetical protein
MKKEPSTLQVLLAKNVFVVIMYFVAFLVPLEWLLSRYLLKDRNDVVGAVFVSIITGILLHRQLAAKLKRSRPENQQP